jgi:opacity protein-like surface antigen
MFKKLMFLFVLLMNLCTIVYAGNLYFSPALFLVNNTTPSSNYRGLNPRLALGYSEMFPDYYLGGEIFGDPASALISNNHDNATSARSTWSVGGSIIPGAMITNSVLAFARLGVISTKFTGPNTTRPGGQVGLGLQTCITPYWDLRVEYDYTFYRTVPMLGAVKSDQVGIGLIYKVIG